MNRSRSSHVFSQSEKNYYRYLSFLASIFMVLAFLFDSPKQLYQGFQTILFSTGQLFTDYIELASMGSTLFNVGTMMLLSILLLYRFKMPINGAVIASLGTVAGFSFFGKNLFNSIPITIGVMLYAHLSRQHFRNYIIVSLFGSALGPLVSFIAFGMGYPLWISIPASIAVGVIIGFVFPPLATQFLGFHQGYSLYNVGFTAGIIGMVFTAMINMMGFEVERTLLLYTGPYQTFLIWFLLAIILFIFLTGAYMTSKQSNQLFTIFSNSGRLPSDFVEMTNMATVCLNVGLLGLIFTAYVMVFGHGLNGPLIGGIISVMSFGAFGKHAKNIIPVLVGVTLAAHMNLNQPASTSVLIAALFGTTLAPISGYYGPLAGFVAGFIHMSMVSHVAYLHGGLNLYNNGFSGGFVAAALVPVLDTLGLIIPGKKK